MSGINIRWFNTPNDPWGHDWLAELIPDFALNLEYHEPCSTPEPTTGLVISNTGTANNYLAELAKSNHTYGVILLSDECLTEQMPYVQDDKCKFVARTYFHPLFFTNPKVFTFGLGYKNGFTAFADPTKLASQRQYDWSFAGSLKGNRGNTLVHFTTLPRHKVHLVDTFNSPEYIGVKEYAELMSDSVFVPTPAGGASIDSFRIYEALEAGAIPVAMKWVHPQIVDPSYWHAIFPNVSALPFVCTDSWHSAAEQASKIVASNKHDRIQQDCLNFWASAKSEWQRMFKNKIECLE